MKVITKDQMFDDFAFIIEINDEQLAQIKLNPSLVETDVQSMIQMVQTKGNHAHILQLTLFNDIAILGHAQRLLKIYDTVSWVRNNKFYIKRK